MQKPVHYHSFREIFIPLTKEKGQAVSASSLKEVMPLDQLEAALCQAYAQEENIYIAVRRNMGNLFTKDIYYGYIKKVDTKGKRLLFEDVDNQISCLIPFSEILSLRNPRN